MNVFARPSFDRALARLSPETQEAVLAAARELPNAFGRPHVHSGLSIRRVGSFFEFRAGLQWRVIFLVAKGDAVLLTVGNHDEVVRFIRENG